MQFASADSENFRTILIFCEKMLASLWQYHSLALRTFNLTQQQPLQNHHHFHSPILVARSDRFGQFRN